MKTIHYLDQYLLDPYHPISIDLIGVGGTGSNLLTQLARIHYALRSMNHPGLAVTTYDPDMVDQTNVGRQLFSETEIGHNKAIALTTRLNRFYGLQWNANPNTYPADSPNSNIIISCVDTVSARLDIQDHLRSIAHGGPDSRKTFYWLDTGNTKNSGQMILSTVHNIKQPNSQYNTIGTLYDVFELYPEFAELTDRDKSPSCTLQQALNEQDLFINSSIAQFTSNFLWKFLTNGFSFSQGFFLNMNNYNINPIPLSNGLS